MRSHSPVEVHAPLIRALAAEKDWAGLTRYWLAHQYVGALDEALILIDRTATRKGGPWLRLARFMEDVRRDPASPDRKLGHVDQGPWNDAERATIHLLMLLPRVVLCERAPYAEENRRSQLFQDGLEACKAARDLSEKIGDRAASAFFLRLIANAYLGLGLPSEAGSIHPGAPDDRLPTALRLVQSDSKSQSQGDSHLLEQAQDHLKEALKIYREMTSEQPKVYRTHVTETLKALGTLEHLLSESGIAATKWWWPFSTQSPRGRWFRSALPLIITLLIASITSSFFPKFSMANMDIGFVILFVLLILLQGLWSAWLFWRYRTEEYEFEFGVWFHMLMPQALVILAAYPFFRRFPVLSAGIGFVILLVLSGQLHVAWNDWLKRKFRDEYQMGQKRAEGLRDSRPGPRFELIRGPQPDEEHSPESSAEQ